MSIFKRLCRGKDSWVAQQKQKLITLDTDSLFYNKGLHSLKHIFTFKMRFFFCQQIIVVLQALNMTRDEIMWLVRHTCNPPPRGRKLNQEDYVDKWEKTSANLMKITVTFLDSLETNRLPLEVVVFCMEWVIYTYSCVTFCTDLQLPELAQAWQ